MVLWWEGWRCVQALRPACARGRTFRWMALTLAGPSVRSDLAGVSSFVRVLGLKAHCDRRFLALCHTPALSLERLTALWVRRVLTLRPGHWVSAWCGWAMV